METYVFALLGLVLFGMCILKFTREGTVNSGGGLILITLAAYLANRLLPDQTTERGLELLAWAWIVL